MNKQMFLQALQRGLAGLPQEDIEERLIFYSEMIDDRMEEGLSEEEAVAQIGPVEEVIRQIIAETPITRIVKEKIRPAGKRGHGNTLLLVLGFPLWFPLLIAAGAVVFSFYVVLWSLIVALWSVEIALIASAFGGIAIAVVQAVRGRWLSAGVWLGAALLCAGLSLLLFDACKAATVGMARLTKKLAVGIKSLFMGKKEDR